MFRARNSFGLGVFRVSGCFGIPVSGVSALEQFRCRGVSGFWMFGFSCFGCFGFGTVPFRGVSGSACFAFAGQASPETTACLPASACQLCFANLFRYDSRIIPNLCDPDPQSDDSRSDSVHPLISNRPIGVPNRWDSLRFTIALLRHAIFSDLYSNRGRFEIG